MKSLKILLPIFIFSIFISYACSDDSTGPGKTIDPPTAEAFNALVDAAKEARIQTTDFNAEDGISFTSEKGVKLNIPANCLALNGPVIDGKVELEYLEVFDKSTMLVTGLPTMGQAPNGDRKILISGGEFYINVTQNGEQLEPVCTMYLLIPTNLTGGVDMAMTLWSGQTDEDGTFVWNKADSTKQDNGVFVEGDQTYYAYFDTFGYTNVDRFMNDPRDKTTLLVRAPKGYTNKNASVYLSYDGEENALANLDIFNEDTGLFSEHYGNIPIGLEMHIIFVSEEDGQYRYAIKGVTVAEDDLYTFTLEETIVGSEQDLVDAIKALP